MSNIPSNVYIQYTPTSSANGEKSYYKLENIPFQHNATTINLNQPISLINQPCLINQNNGGSFQTAVINNQCAPTNYVSLAAGNWNHGMQQVIIILKSDHKVGYRLLDILLPLVHLGSLRSHIWVS